MHRISFIASIALLSLVTCHREIESGTKATPVREHVTASQPRDNPSPLPNLQFATGEQSPRTPSIDISHGLPPRVAVARIIANPRRYADKVVTIVGCYMVDPYHGAVLSDSPTWQPGNAISVLGGSDDTVGRPFNWMTQQVCGTLVGRVVWKPTEEPLRSLCGEICFIGDQTLAPRIVDQPKGH